MSFIITIDGPAASGKSSVARAVAKKLGFVFVSSGAYYRALAWSASKKQLDLFDEKKVADWLASLNVECSVTQGEVHLFLNGLDPAPHLTEPHVTALVSPLAALPAVRSFLLEKLRALAESHDRALPKLAYVDAVPGDFGAQSRSVHEDSSTETTTQCAAEVEFWKGSNIVMEGRDIGSVVFPKADFKFYLDASLEERMRRRAKEGVTDAIAARDKQDTTRALAPLSIPQGAVVIDSTHLSIEETVQKIVDHVTSSQK